MSLIKIRRIPLTFKGISWKLDFHEMNFVPFLMIMLETIFMTMSLAALEMPLLSYMTLAGVILSFIIMFILFIHNRELTHYGFLYICFFLILIGITIIYMQDIKNCIYLSINVWLALLIFRYYRDRVKMVYISFAIALSICAYLNFAHIMSHPLLWISDKTKDSSGFLLGFNYNQMGCRLIIALATSMICIRFSKIWILNSITLAIVCIISLALVGSMTSLSMIVLFVLFCLIPSVKIRKLGIVGFFTIYLLFQTFVVFSGKGLENNEMAVYFVVDVLHKDITFTGRTYMWDAALKIIEQSPVWGWGFATLEWYKSYMSSFAAGPHNFILSILINGGILLFSLFIAITLKSYKAIKPFINTRTGQDLIFATICLYFMALMEMYPYPIMFYMLICINYYPYICKNKQI